MVSTADKQPLLKTPKNSFPRQKQSPDDNVTNNKRSLSFQKNFFPTLNIRVYGAPTGEQFVSELMVDVFLLYQVILM